MSNPRIRIFVLEHLTVMATTNQNSQQYTK